MYTGKARRAVTLVEVLLCGALSLILLQLLHGLLVASRTYLDHARSKAELQTQLLRAVQILSQELVESNYSAMAADPDNDSLSFPSPRNRAGRHLFDAQGRLLWMRLVGVQKADYQGQPCLVRWDCEIETPVSDPPSPVGLPWLQSQPGVRIWPLARNISLFKAEIASDGTVAYRMRAELKLTLRRYAVEIEEKVLPRN